MRRNVGKFFAASTGLNFVSSLRRAFVLKSCWFLSNGKLSSRKLHTLFILLLNKVQRTKKNVNTTTLIVFNTCLNIRYMNHSLSVKVTQIMHKKETKKRVWTHVLQLNGPATEQWDDWEKKTKQFFYWHFGYWVNSIVGVGVFSLNNNIHWFVIIVLPSPPRVPWNIHIVINWTYLVIFNSKLELCGKWTEFNSEIFQNKNKNRILN